MRIGGQVRVRATTDIPGDLTPESADVQPIIAATDVGTWLWSIRPAAPGEFTVRVFITVLYADTGTPLLPEESVAVPVFVAAPAFAAPPLWADNIRSVACLLIIVGIIAVVSIRRWFSGGGLISRLRLRLLRRRAAAIGNRHRPPGRTARRAYERAEAQALYHYRLHAGTNPSAPEDDIIVQLALLGERSSDGHDDRWGTAALTTAMRLYAPLSDRWPQYFRPTFCHVHEIAERTRRLA